MAYRRAAATLGRNLRALRTGQRWTLERAAEATDMDPTQLAKIEAGTVNVTLVTLARLADGFGVAVADLFLRRQPVRRLARGGRDGRTERP